MSVVQLQTKIRNQRSEINALKKNGGPRNGRSTDAIPSKRLAIAENVGTAAVRNLLNHTINPGGCSPLRYPDEHATETAVVRQINTLSLPYTTPAAISDYPAGSFYVEVHPELVKPIRILQDGNPEVNGIITHESNEFGLRLASGQKISRAYAPVDGPLTVGEAKDSSEEVVWVVMPMMSDDGDLQPPIFIKDSGYYYCDTEGGRLTYILDVSDSDTVISGSFIIEQVDSDGVVCATASTDLSLVAPPVTVQNVMALNGITGPANKLASWGLRITCTCNHQVSVRLSVQYSQSWFEYKGYSLKDWSSLDNAIEKYRITAQSGLITYFGDLLTTAGKMASMLYKGGKPIQMSGVFDYQTVSDYPVSYNNALYKGAYGYWEPQTYEDMFYRSSSAGNPYKRPYLIFAGRVNDISASPDPLRLRVHTHLEFSTISQSYPLAPSPVRPELITAMTRILHAYPNTMENGEHFEKLKSMLKSVGQAAIKVGKALFDHRDDLQDIAALAGPIIMSLV